MRDGRKSNKEEFMLKGDFNSKGRQMGITPKATTPRDPHKHMDEGDAGKRGTPRKENHFSFGKIPNK